MMKLCGSCRKEKSLSDFSVRRKSKDGRQHRCKECARLYSLTPAAVASVKKSKQRPEFKRAQKALLGIKRRTESYRAGQRIRRKRPKSLRYFRKYTKDRKKKDVSFKLAALLRTRLYQATTSRPGSAVRDLGCSIPELRLYLEALFKPGMAWTNRGRGPGTWQLDHIRPLVSFDLTQRDQLLQACHYTNLQPLWHDDHSAKTAREITTRCST